MYILTAFYNKNRQGEIESSPVFLWKDEGTRFKNAMRFGVASDGKTVCHDKLFFIVIPTKICYIALC